VRVAVAAMLLVFLGSSAFALSEDARRAPAPASASDSTAPASASTANAASATTSVLPHALVAALPDAPPISAEVRTVEPVSPAPPLTPPAALIKLKTPPHPHSFFDARNRVGFATLGASLTADALSTQKGLAYPGFVEMNPIARPFVQSRMGAAVYNAGSFGLMAGLMYLAHKKEHHKLERILPLAVGSWEGLLSMRNYHAIANRAR
jgi:hypothetical protein